MSARLPGPGRGLPFLAGLCAAYVACGKAGLAFASLSPSASAIWPATGLALAAVMLFGPRVAPAIFAGAFLVNYTTAGVAWTALAIGAGNTLEAVLGAALAQRFAGGVRCFDSAAHLFRFVLIAAAAALASATIGVGSLVLDGQVHGPDWRGVWLTWWLGDLSGALVVAPLLVLLHTRPGPGALRERGTEATAIAIALAVTGYVVFVHNSEPLAFLTLPPLGWAAFRLGQREVAVGLLLLAVVATAGSLAGRGPFGADPEAGLLILQGYLAITAAAMLLVGALVAAFREATASAAATAEQAAAANRAKDEFLSMLSHELRNPLHAISNSVALLLHSKEPGRTGLALQVLQRQSQHLSRIVEDLLDVTNAVGGRIAFRTGPVDLAAAVARAADEAQAAAPGSGHAVQVATSPAWVRADADRLHQVLMHLLQNAIRFTPAGGTVRIACGHDAGHGWVDVVDTGIGMSPDLLQRIFEPFAQGERGIDRRQGGLGIGLTLAKRFVEQQGGRIEAHSAGPGRGSRFSLRLPAAEQPPAAAQGSARAPGRLRILVVEDNDDSRVALRALLEAVGHEVHEAADGRQGIKATLELEPDVALVDIGLPEVDGYELARQVRAAGGRSRLVALTGYGRAEDRARTQAAGYDSHLVKPVPLAELQELLAGQAGRQG